MSEKKKLFTATFTFEGKRYYVRSAKSQRDADKRAAIKQQELEAGSLLITKDMLVADYAMQWLETYKSTTVSESVYIDYVGRIRNHIIPAIGGMKMRQVRPTNLQRILNAQAGKSKSLCTKIRYTLSQIFSQAIKDGVIQTDPSLDLALPKAVDGTHRSLTDEERAAILEAAKTHRLGNLVRVLLYCGLRPQEAVALCWSDVDRINNRLVISRALKRDGNIGETKSESGARSVPIPPAIQDIFSSPGSLNEYIFTTPTGKRFSSTSLRQAWRNFLRDVDIALGAEYELYYGKPRIIQSALAPDLTMYCLRHTYCTDLEAAGVPINVARYLMGHSSIVLTSRIYTHIRDDTLADAAEKIAAFGATASATNQEEISVITEYKPQEDNRGKNIG